MGQITVKSNNFALLMFDMPLYAPFLWSYPCQKLAPWFAGKFPIEFDAFHEVNMSIDGDFPTMFDILRPCSNPKTLRFKLEVVFWYLPQRQDIQNLCRGIWFHTFSDLPISSGFYMSFQNIFRRFPWLVGSTILKNMKVSWEGLSHI